MSTTPPRKWARDKRHRAKRYATDEFVGVMRKSLAVAMPGVPLAAAIGIACNGSDNENTTGWIAGDDRERAEATMKGRKPLGGDPATGYGHVGSDDLHELGRFGPEGNRCPQPVATGDCPWVDLARSETVNKILGRPGVEGADWYDAIEDQIAIGIADIALHAREVRKKFVKSNLDSRLLWEEDGDGGPKVWTLWPLFCGVSGWSAGNGGINRHLSTYAAELAALPPSHRVGTFLRLAGLVDDPGNKHRQDEYTALRWAQKYEAMLLALEFTGESNAAAWLDDGLGSDREAVYARLVSIA